MSTLSTPKSLTQHALEIGLAVAKTVLVGLVSFAVVFSLLSYQMAAHLKTATQVTRNVTPELLIQIPHEAGSLASANASLIMVGDLGYRFIQHLTLKEAT